MIVRISREIVVTWVTVIGNNVEKDSSDVGYGDCWWPPGAVPNINEFYTQKEYK